LRFRPPVGHPRQRAHDEVLASVARGHADRDLARDLLRDLRRRARAPAALADRLRPRRRLVSRHRRARPARFRLAPRPLRGRQSRRTARLPRPLLCGLHRARRRCLALPRAADRGEARRVGLGLPVPAGGGRARSTHRIDPRVRRGHEGAIAFGHSARIPVGRARAVPRMTPSFDAGEDFAKRLDERDPLAPFRLKFAVPSRRGQPVIYFNGNSLGLMPTSVERAVLDELKDWADLAVDAHFAGKTPWFSYHEVLREPGARLVGGLPGEVVMMNGLTVNLHLMMATFFRPAGGRDKILIEDGAFPSDTYAAQSQLDLHGVDREHGLIRVAPRPGESLLRTEDLIELIERRGSEIAVVLLPGVQFYTGQLLDIAAVTRAARRKGCVAGWDLAHAAGNVPLTLHDWDVDFAVWCSYKYLNSGPGAVAGCFVHERHGANPALVRMAGWWGNDPATRFRMHEQRDFVPRAGADGWQVSNPPILAMAPLRASLQ